MPPLRRIICLANSRKHGAHCIAGIEPASGEWIRPVSDLDDGRIERGMIQLGGRQPGVGDVLEIPLADSGPDFGFECENRSLLAGPWRLVETVKPAQLIPWCSTERPILHTDETAVTVQYLQSLPLPQRRTLQLVEAFELETFSSGPSAQGGHRWNASFVSALGDRLTARITDPVLIDKLEQGYLPAPHCLVTVSLSMPYRPDDWEAAEDPCWKLIAAVIELEPALRQARKQPPTIEAVASRRRDMQGLDERTVRETLKRVFGYDSFRPNQAEIVRAILDGRDAFVVMPTGGGKSLCYQLPAHLLSGTCIVVSPLVSLMKDQVDAATVTGLRAATLNSSLMERERTEVFRRLFDGEIDLLYVSPERFAMDAFLNTIKRIPLSLVAIDEAHCVSEWGHDFRPDYLFLSEVVKHFPETPVAAFTATATHRVQQDIVERLGLRSPFVVRASFNRPNLRYEVRRKDDIETQILTFIREHRGEPGIVYRTSRRGVDKLTETLREAGIPALPYHAGLDDPTRTRNQDAFSRDEVEVIVATVAFGMGIDKANIRYVLHADLPKNMESYYQETGRAGRDGEPAHCILYFGRGDIPRIRHFIEQVLDDTERRRLNAALGEMVSYAGGSNMCRRRRILAYFGEVWPERSCDNCDVCAGDIEQEDATREAQMVLSAIVRTGERFGAVHVIDILVGADTKRIRQFRHDELPTYGVGSEFAKKYWREVLDELLAANVVVQSDGQYPVLKLGEHARGILRGEKQFMMQRRVKTASPVAPTREPTPERSDLFEKLRTLRARLASERGVPAYVVFSDKTLHDMCARLPTSEEAMRATHGVGEAKLAAYGDVFMHEISAYLTERGGSVDMHASGSECVGLPKKPSQDRKRRKGQTVDETWDLLCRGMDVTEVAAERGLSESTICDHIEHLLMDGRMSEIEPYVPEEVRRELERVIPLVDSTFLRQIVDACAIPVSFPHAKIVRAWLRVRAQAEAGL